MFPLIPTPEIYINPSHSVKGMDPKKQARLKNEAGTITREEMAIEPMIAATPVFISHPHHKRVLEDLFTSLSLELSDIRIKKQRGQELTQEDRRALLQLGELSLKVMKTEVELEAKETKSLNSMSDAELLELSKEAADFLQSPHIKIDR